MRPPHTLLCFVVVVAAIANIAGCSEDDDDGHDGTDDTGEVGTFDGLFDGVATGFNFPLDIAIVPDHPDTEEIDGGDIYVASYGTSELMRVADPTGEASVGDAESFFDGTSEGLRGATAVSIPEDGSIWATFEQGGSNGAGGLALLDQEANVIRIYDDGDEAGAFARPGGLCWGGISDDGAVNRMFMVNLDDGTLWRLEFEDAEGSDASFTLLGDGLATGSAGSPGSPGSGLSSSKDLPEGGARGCVHHDGAVYVADAQNARVVRFDDADVGEGVEGVALEDTPAELATYPTGVSVNEDGDLIVISYDNAHAFVSLEMPGGGFIDNGLHDLNVNAGNHGVALAHGTIWFTRANNSNGTLRAVTPNMETLPTTEGPFPPQ